MSPPAVNCQLNCILFLDRKIQTKQNLNFAMYHYPTPKRHKIGEYFTLPPCVQNNAILIFYPPKERYKNKLGYLHFLAGGARRINRTQHRSATAKSNLRNSRENSWVQKPTLRIKISLSATARTWLEIITRKWSKLSRIYSDFYGAVSSLKISIFQKDELFEI